MKFFVFEGLDGAGKSTLIQKVQTYLQQQQRETCFIRDPGGTDLGEKIRQLILDPQWSPAARTEVLLYQASRAQLVHEKIRPALSRGTWVLSDRFYSSTVAFQCFARGLARQDIQWLNSYACAGVVPDLVVYIDISVDESEKRVQKRVQGNGENKDRMEQENRTFHEKVRQGYLMQAQENPQSWLVIDGQKTPDELFAEVLSYFRSKKWLDS